MKWKRRVHSVSTDEMIERADLHNFGNDALTSAKLAMKSCAFARRAASSISSRVASGFPYRMLFSIVVAKRAGS